MPIHTDFSHNFLFLNHIYFGIRNVDRDKNDYSRISTGQQGTTGGFYTITGEQRCRALYVKIPVIPVLFRPRPIMKDSSVLPRYRLVSIRPLFTSRRDNKFACSSAALPELLSRTSVPPASREGLPMSSTIVNVIYNPARL